MDYQAMFDQGVDRRGTNCVKWDGRQEVFGNADVVPMWIADAEFAAPQPVIDALAARVQHGAFGYSAHNGADKKAACEWLTRRHGVQNPDPEWMLFSPGVVDALYLAILALTEPTDTIAIQPPVYGPFSMVTEKSGRKLYENNLIPTEDGSWKMDLADLEKGLQNGVKLLILCSPHNPIGRIWTEQELTDLVALLNKYDAKLLCDEIHHDLIMPGHKHTTILNIPGAEKAVMAMAPSKTFNLAGLQYSFFVIRDSEIRKKVAAQIASTGIESGNVLGEIATEAAYKYGDEWLDELLIYLDGNRKFVENYFAEKMPEVKLSKLEGTYLMWVDFRAWGKNEADLKELLIRNGAGMNVGSFFGAKFEGFMRMNLATPRRNLQAGLDNIYKAALEVRG